MELLGRKKIWGAGGRNDYRRKILASPSAAVHSSPGQTSTLLTFMGKDSWDPSCFYPQITFPLFASATSNLKVHLKTMFQLDPKKQLMNLVVIFDHFCLAFLKRIQISTEQSLRRMHISGNVKMVDFF